SDTPKKKKLQEQIDVQVARELEEEMARDVQRMNEQIAKDAEIARIHVEEELQIMIDRLDRNNETVTNFDHFLEIPSGESKVHIEVLSVLWGNRLSIPDDYWAWLVRTLDVSVFIEGKESKTDKSLLALSVRTPVVSVFKKVKGVPKFEIRYWLCRLGCPMRQLFKGPKANNVAIIIIKLNFDSRVI
nr:hypothetical protein [Tanacetum cinerariifolium]